MHKIYFKQAIQMLRQNPFISIISILGTALAIMMIMVIIVANNIHNVNEKPEVNRHRSFYAYEFAVQDTVMGWSSSGFLHRRWVQEQFYQLQVPEAVTAFEFSMMQNYRQSIVQREGERELHQVNMRFVDNAFWRVFEFDFVQGVPFTQEEFEAGVRRAVISEAMARRLFRGENPVGRNILIDNVPYSVSGVVRNVSPVFRYAFGDVWAPWLSKQGNQSQRFHFLVVVLARDVEDYPLIAAEIEEYERRFGMSNAPEVLRLGAPVPHAHFEVRWGGDNRFVGYDDRVKRNRLENIRTVLLFVLLLLVPATNLSGFSISRMKKRVTEIGIRKAFGARVGTIFYQVVYENIITSSIGGVIGLVLSYVAVLLLKGWILGVEAGANIPLGMLVSPVVFPLVALFCVLLGVMSSGIPALRAARMNIVKSIAGSDNS